MDELPPYAPTRFYQWQQTDAERKRSFCIMFGWNLIGGSLGFLCPQLFFALFTAQGAAEVGWYMTAAWALLGLLSFLAAYLLPWLAQALESRRQDAYWARIKFKSFEESTRPYVVEYLEFLNSDSEAPSLRIIMRRPDSLTEETATVPVSGAAWIGGTGEKPWVVFPAVNYAAGDDGIIRGDYGRQAMIMSRVNEFGLQRWTETALNDPTETSRRMLEGL